MIPAGILLAVLSSFSSLAVNLAGEKKETRDLSGIEERLDTIRIELRQVRNEGRDGELATRVLAQEIAKLTAEQAYFRRRIDLLEDFTEGRISHLPYRPAGQR
jgi:hypothetical protein